MSNTKSEETKPARELLKEIQSEDAPDRKGASAILYIESSSSFCGECGQQTIWWSSKTHEEIAGYGHKRKGCMAKFVAATPLYGLSEQEVELLEEETGLPVVRSSPFPKRS